ncbi:MAG: hypothetical protein ACRDYZ_16845 [Acidimicrobiales bacterium]
MPAETHQRGDQVDAGSVLELLQFLLGDHADEPGEEVPLSALDVDADNLGILWDTVREELAERTVGPEIDPGDLDPGDLDPSMTLAEAAKAMASLLEGAGDDGHRR